MYKFRMIVEADCETAMQAQTVQRKLQQAMKAAFDGAPYAIRGAVSAPERVSPIMEAPSVIIPAGAIGHG